MYIRNNSVLRYKITNKNIMRNKDKAEKKIYNNTKKINLIN